MPKRRIHIESSVEADSSFTLEDEQAHYLWDVLRLGTGEEVELFDGDGVCFLARLAEVRGRVEVLRRIDRDTESPCRITLFQAIAKGDRFEWVLQKATEAGVSEIIPIETERTIVRIPQKKRASRRERWERVVSEASRQSRRSVVPPVSEPMSFPDATLAQRRDFELVLHPDSDLAFKDAVAPDLDSAALWIGPEGGFTEAELEALSGRATCVRFGPRILRSETAGVAAVVALQLLTGGLS